MSYEEKLLVHLRLIMIFFSVIGGALFGFAWHARAQEHHHMHGAKQADADFYDISCCSLQDCSVALNVIPGTPDKPMTITTTQATANVTKDTRWLESKDGRTHACIAYGRVLCVYQAPSN